MRTRRLLALLPLALAACLDSTGGTPTAETPLAEVAPERRMTIQEPERVYPGRVLARFVAGVRAEDVAPAYGLSVERHGRGNTFVVLRGAAAGNEQALAARLGADARVVYAEPDYLRRPTAVDPALLWAFHNPGGLYVLFTSGRNRGQPVTSFLSTADADEDNLVGYASGGAEVLIGSIDTGVDLTHPEFLPGQLIAGDDWYSGDKDPADEDGHGTHTTGTMVGQNVGVAGVAGAGGNVKVLVQRVCGPLGCPTSAIVSAIYAAADSGVVAMNLSLGGSSEAQSEKDAIAYAVGTKGALVIASAGNNGTSTVSCPACDPLAISVGATNWQDGLTYYTNWGTGLDITAPGGQMYSNTTEEGGIYSAWPGGGYAFLQGTSMAAPQVTGTAAVVASKAGLSGGALRIRLLTTTDDKGTSGYDTNYGCGRLNTYRAVLYPSNADGSNTVFTGNPCNVDPANSGGGNPPSLTASFTYSCGGNSTCSFDASGSTGATSYGWTFGDGSSDTGVTASHTYTGTGNFTVTLTTGNGSTTAETSKTISCTSKRGRLRCS